MASINIPLCKKKILIVIILAFGFLILSYLLMVNPEKFVSHRYRSVGVIYIAGIVGVIFSAVGLAIGLKKIFSNKPGLVISDEGILDNTSVFKYGLIDWKDITDIKAYNIKSQHFLAVYIKTTDKYLDREKNIFIKKLMKSNIKLSGTPININLQLLRVDKAELQHLLQKELEKQKSGRIEE